MTSQETPHDGVRKRTEIEVIEPEKDSLSGFFQGKDQLSMMITIRAALQEGEKMTRVRTRESLARHPGCQLGALPASEPGLPGCTLILVLSPKKVNLRQTPQEARP